MAKIDKGIDGKYKLTAYMSYEIKNTAPMRYSVSMPNEEIKKRVRDMRKLVKLLRRMKKHGWEIENIEVGVDE